MTLDSVWYIFSTEVHGADPPFIAKERQVILSGVCNRSRGIESRHVKSRIDEAKRDMNQSLQMPGEGDQLV